MKTIGVIEVFSQRRGAKPPPAHFIQILIDRPSGSSLQNPIILHNESDRESVLSQFEIYFRKKLRAKDESIIAALNRIVDLVMSGQSVALMCWCAPKACHGNTVKRICEKKVKRLCEKAGRVKIARSGSTKGLFS